ncbi:SGNH/GDSL hydrolase family protein [Spirosoma litoris]
MKKLLSLWLLLSSVLALGQVRFQPLSTTATPGTYNRVAPRAINLYPINTAGNSTFMAAVNTGSIPVRVAPTDGAIVGRYSYTFLDTRLDYQNNPVVSDPAPVLADGVRTVPRLVGNFYPFASQTGKNVLLWKRIPPFTPHSSKIIIYPGGLYSDTTDNALLSRGFTHTAESSKWIDGQTYPTQFKRALEMANYQAAYTASFDPAATSDQQAKLLAWAGYGSGNFEGTHTFIPDEETCRLYAKYWWATFKQNDWAGAGVEYFSVNHEVFQARNPALYAQEWYNQVGWITKGIIDAAALEGKTLKSGMSDWANLTNVNPQNFEDIDGTGYPKYMSYGYIGEPFRGSSQSAPLGNSTVLGQLMKEGKAFVGVGSYLQHTIDDQSYFQKNADGTYKKGSDGGLIWRTDKRTTTISGQPTVIYGDDYYKSQLKLYGRFARYHANLYFRAGGVHLPRSDVRQSGFEAVRLLAQFRLDTEVESGMSPSSTGTTEVEFATLNSRPLNPDMVETDAITMYLLTDYMRGWSESRPRTTLGANNGGKQVASAEFYAKGFQRASQLNWIFSTPWTLIQPKLWIKGTGTLAPYDASEAFYRKPIIWGGLATKDGHPTIFLNWVWPCQDTDRYTDVTVWVDKGSGVVSPGYRIRLKGRKPGLDYWTLPDALAGVQPKDIYFQFKSLLGEKITWRGDYREARITSHPTPPAIVESDLSGASVSNPGSTTTDPGSTTVSAPSWIAGMRYSYSAPLLTLEAAGDIGAMKFERLDGTPFTVSNPNGVQVSSGNYYGYGTLSDQAPYDKQWKLFYNNTAPLRVTVQRASATTSTFSYTVTPVPGADRVVLSTNTVVTNPVSYSRVFVVGNSITHTHYRRNGESAPTPERDNGMDASSPAQDYLHILTNYLKTLNASVDVREFASFENYTVPTGGWRFDVGDGPRWEGTYWDLNVSTDIFKGGLGRYQPITDWMPDLIIIRIGENVLNLEHDFKTALKALIDKLKEKNPSCRVIITTSVWQEGNQQQVDVSNLLKDVASERSYTLVELAGIAGSKLGTLNHPNDPAMQTIADRIWTGIGATPPTSTTTTNPPTTAYFANGFGEGSVSQLMGSAPFTPDFTNPANNQYSGWGTGNVYQYISDGVVKLGISKMGGALTHLSLVGGKNWVNTNADGSTGVYENTTGWPDPGRSGFWSMYGNPGHNYQQGGESTSQYYDTGFNVVQGGSVYKNYSQVTWYEKRTVPGYGEVMFTRSTPVQWALHNKTSGVTYYNYFWIDANHVPRYFTIIDNQRTDTQRTYMFRQSEAPFIYTTADLYHHYVYTGSAPGTSGSVTSINPDAPVECGCPDNHKWGTQTTTSEGWVASMNDDNKGIVLVPQHNSNFNTFQVLSRSGDEFSNATSYIESAQNQNFDENSTTAYSGYIYVGTMSGFRSWFNSAGITRPGFDWKFGVRTMNGWWSQDSEAKFNSDNRYQFRFARTDTDGQGFGGYFFAPYGIYKPAEIPKIYVQGKFTNVSKILIRWYKAGQTELQALQAPGGQFKTLDVIGDGVERTYTLDMTGVTNWNGIISTIRITNPEDATGHYNQTFVPSYIGSKNPNP